MSAKIPLGQPESQELEFKGRDALKHLPSIGREVVAMLNSGGGEVWIGLAEDHGRAVQIEGIENAQREIGRLRDHLADSIELSPAPEDVKVEEVSNETGQSVLRIRVQPQAGTRRYSHREGTARHFLKRVADRVRSMSHEEIFGSQSDRDPLEETKRKIQAERDRLQKQKRDLLWLRIQPVDNLGLSLDRDFSVYFSDFAKTGNRRSGWSFVNPYIQPIPGKGRLVHGEKEGPCTTLFDDGGIEFALPLSGLYWKAGPWQLPQDENAKDLWPYCLLEYPTSVLRLASAVYKEKARRKAAWVLGDLALFGLEGWTLRPHSVRSIRYAFRRSEPFSEPDLVWDEPLQFRWEEIIKYPDRCAFRLVQRVYAAFGFYEDEMPEDFDRETGVLRFPKE